MNCTDITTCIVEANQAFAWWNVIVSPLLSMVLTFSISILVIYVSPLVGGIISSMPTSVTLSTFGTLVNNMNGSPDPVAKFSHTVPIGLLVSSFCFYLWPLLLSKIKVENERIKQYVIYPLSLLIIAVLWVVVMGVIATLIYFINLDVNSTIVLGVAFEVITLIMGVILAFKRRKTVTSSKKFSWSLIPKSIISGVVVCACLVIGKFKLPVISGVIASFPVIKLTVLFGLLYNEGYDTFNYVAEQMIIGNGSAGVFTMCCYYLLLVSHAFVAITVGYLLSVVLVTLPLLLIMKRNNLISSMVDAYRSEA